MKVFFKLIEIIFYSIYFQVIQISKLPVVITLIARSSANTGYLLTLEEMLDPLVQNLRGEVNLD